LTSGGLEQTLFSTLFSSHAAAGITFFLQEKKVIKKSRRCVCRFKDSAKALPGSTATNKADLAQRRFISRLNPAVKYPALSSAAHSMNCHSSISLPWFLRGGLTGSGVKKVLKNACLNVQ